MPEKPPSSRERPSIPLFAKMGGDARRPRPRRPGEPAYAELLAASNFSFLRGSSHPEELAATATFLGLAGFAVADRNTLAGIVRGHLAARLFFRGIYFPQLGTRAWLRLLYANRKTIFSLTREGFTLWRRSRARRNEPRAIASAKNDDLVTPLE